MLVISPRELKMRQVADATRLLWRPRHMSSKPRSRRQFLRQVGIAAGLAAVPLARRGRAQTKRQVTMRLDWLYQGPNAGFLIAQEKGFYEQAGLNVIGEHRPACRQQGRAVRVCGRVCGRERR